MLRLSNFWDFMEKFKHACKIRGWKVFEREDIVDENGRYHQIVLVHQIHFETFRRVTTSFHRFIRERETLNMIDISYIAWISQNPIPESVLDFLAAEPRLLSRIALYDLSLLDRGRNVCLKINETDSVVFQEFERFLAGNGFSLLPLTKKNCGFGY